MIYVIGEMSSDGTMTEFVKVGFVNGGEEAFARAIKRRVNKLQVGNPRRMVVVGKTNGSRADEKALHYRFHGDRVRRPQATEWLRLEPGSAFAAWVDSVRIDVLTFGVTLRPKKTAPVRVNRCGRCRSLEHTYSKCPDVALMERRAEQAAAIAKATRLADRAAARALGCRWCGVVHDDRRCARFAPTTASERARYATLESVQSRRQRLRDEERAKALVRTSSTPAWRRVLTEQG